MWMLCVGDSRTSLSFKVIGEYHTPRFRPRATGEYGRELSNHRRVAGDECNHAVVLIRLPNYKMIPFDLMWGMNENREMRANQCLVNPPVSPQVLFLQDLMFSWRRF